MRSWVLLVSAAGLGSDAMSAVAAYQLPMPGLSDAPWETLNRWGHAHSELDGLQHWAPATDEGRRAYTQLAGALYNFGRGIGGRPLASYYPLLRSSRKQSVLSRLYPFITQTAFRVVQRGYADYQFVYPVLLDKR